jgi:predicted phage-related endonuclease
MTMTVERRPITDRAEWLEWRKFFVTASDVPTLFGCHPYRTALRVYMEKSGVEFEQKDSPVMRRGRILEPAVGAAVAEARPDWQIEPARAFFCDASVRIAATPDFLIGGDPRGVGVLQAKTADPAVYARDWSGGAEVPFWIQLQALTEAMLTDAAFCVVAVLSVDPYGLPCSIHEIARHPEAEAKILSAVYRFWLDVEAGVEPQPDYGRDAALIKLLAPREATPEQIIDLRGSNELPELLSERALRKARQASDRDRCEAIETQIKFLMRDAAVATGVEGWRITYKTGTVQGYSVPTREQRVLRIKEQRKTES